MAQDVYPDTSSDHGRLRGLLDDDHPQYLTRGDQAGFVAVGGGIVTWVSDTLIWSSRLIILSQGFGGAFSSDGYYEMTVPVNGTVVPGVGGASDVAVASGAIPVGVGQALWYLFTSGSPHNSQDGNWRISSSSAAFLPDRNWFLVAVSNSDTGALWFCTDVIIPDGYSIAAGEGVPFGAVAPSTAFGQASNDGGSSAASRADHGHGLPVHSISSHLVGTDIGGGLPASSAFGDPQSLGSGTGAARSDHVHDRTGDGAVHWMTV